jgi:hypothetical protein
VSWRWGGGGEGERIIPATGARDGHLINPILLKLQTLPYSSVLAVLYQLWFTVQRALEFVCRLVPATLFGVALGGYAFLGVPVVIAARFGMRKAGRGSKLDPGAVLLTCMLDSTWDTAAYVLAGRLVSLLEGVVFVVVFLVSYNGHSKMWSSSLTLMGIAVLVISVLLAVLAYRAYRASSSSSSSPSVYRQSAESEMGDLSTKASKLTFDPMMPDTKSSLTVPLLRGDD